MRSGSRMEFCLKSPENGVLAFPAAREFSFYRECKGWKGFLVSYAHKEFPQTLSLQVVSTTIHPEAERALDKIRRGV